MSKRWFATGLPGKAAERIVDADLALGEFCGHRDFGAETWYIEGPDGSRVWGSYQTAGAAYAAACWLMQAYELGIEMGMGTGATGESPTDDGVTEDR